MQLTWFHFLPPTTPAQTPLSTNLSCAFTSVYFMTPMIKQGHVRDWDHSWLAISLAGSAETTPYFLTL